MELIFSPNIMDAVKLSSKTMDKDQFTDAVKQIAKDVTASLGATYGDIIQKILEEYPEIEAEMIPYEQFMKSRLRRVDEENKDGT